MNKIYSIDIDNHIALAPIIGLNGIRTDANSLKKYVSVNANWLD